MKTCVRWMTLLFAAGCFLVLRWYPLSGSTWEAIKRWLSPEHAQKESQYLQARARE